MILTKYALCLRRGLPFSLDDEVKKLGGKLRST